MDQISDKLAESINEDPKVFMECSTPEIFCSIGAASLVGVITAIVTTLLLSFMLALVISTLVVLGVAYLLLSLIGSISDKHHSSWLKEKVFIMKYSLGLIGNPFESHSSRYGRGPRRGG